MTCAKNSTARTQGTRLLPVYDALDRTISQTYGSTTTAFHYRGTSETLTRMTAGSAVTVYASSASGTPLAQKGSSTQFYISDPHGDIVSSVSTSAAAVSTRAYDPYGRPLASTGTAPVLGYQEDLTDQDTGLLDMGTRHYSPSLGRFTSRDVLEGDATFSMSLNRHAYAGANPVTMIDPTGMLSIAGSDPTQSDYVAYGDYTSCKTASGAGCANKAYGAGSSFQAPAPPAPVPTYNCARRCGIPLLGAVSVPYPLPGPAQDPGCGFMWWRWGRRRWRGA
jgi:RHS repeat-associated protein